MQDHVRSAVFMVLLSVLSHYASALNIAQTSGSSTLSLQSLTSSITQTPLLTPFPTGAATYNQACSFVSSAVRFCNEVSPGFSTAPYTDQRSCLCGASTTIGQLTGAVSAVFDGEVSLCADYAFTAAAVEYPGLTSLEGFCSRPFQMPSTSSGSGSGATSSTISTAGSPTQTSSSPTSGNGSTGGDGIQNLTTGGIAGISVGCGAAAFLAGFGLYVGIRKKKLLPSNEPNGDEKAGVSISPQAAALPNTELRTSRGSISPATKSA